MHRSAECPNLANSIKAGTCGDEFKETSLVKELLVENSEGARTRILALTNCLEAGPEAARGGGEVGYHKEHACCLPSGFIGQLGFLDVTCERLNDQGMWLCSIGPGQQACSQAGDESTACIARSWLGGTPEPAASY